MSILYDILIPEIQKITKTPGDKIQNAYEIFRTESNDYNERIKYIIDMSRNNPNEAIINEFIKDNKLSDFGQNVLSVVIKLIN